MGFVDSESTQSESDERLVIYGLVQDEAQIVYPDQAR